MQVLGIVLAVAAPVLAEAPPTFELQGADLAGEFVHQPYWLAPGTLAGHHVRLQAGLLGFSDGSGTAATGYCIDARAHRRHDAHYRGGDFLRSADVANAPQLLWLLGHAYPNGPESLGIDAVGRARTSSAVQAAIWHFSDGFDLDAAGSPWVDPAYRAYYDQLLAAASVGRNAAPAAMTVQLSRVGATGSEGLAVMVRFTSDDGGAVPDGTTVTVRGDGVEVELKTRQGEASTVLRLRQPGAAFTVRVEGTIAIAPGRVLVSNLPTQRLVETSWGRESVSAVASLAPRPAPSPLPTSTPSPGPVPTSTPLPTPTATAGVVQSPVPPLGATPPGTPPQAVSASVISMPATGRAPAVELGFAAGLILFGAGLLLGAGACQPRRTPRRIAYSYSPPGGEVSGCAHPAQTERCRRP